MLKSCTLNVMVPMTVVSSCILLGVLFYELCLTPSYQGASSVSWENNNGGGRVFKLFKRHVQQSDKFEHIHRCVRASPSRRDLEKLCRHQECRSIYCLRPCACGEDCLLLSVNATCFSKACSVFDVTVKNGRKTLTEYRTSLDQLSWLISKHGGETDDISVKCSDPHSHLFDAKLFLEITRDSSVQCKAPEITEIHDVETEINELRNESSINLHLIYFRFLSQWESFFKLPQLNSFIEYKRQDPQWNVHSFDNMQSLSLGLDQNIQLLLRGRPLASQDKGSSNEEDVDLIQTSIDTGRCAVFNYIACHTVPVYEELVNITSSEQNAKNCKLRSGKHEMLNMMRNEINNLTFCSSDDLGGDDLNLEDALYIDDHLNHIYSKTSAKLFSLTIVNILDLSSTTTFDSSITKVVSDILSRQTNVLILLSDVGDPRFTKLDESVFLRTQIYNPLLHVLTPRNVDWTEKWPMLTAEISRAKTTERNSQLISLSEVFGFTRGLILSENPRHFGDHRSINSSNGTEDTQSSRETAVCPAKGIKSPIECLCLGRHVRFPSDSVQAAFATSVVGNINDQLSLLSSIYAKKMAELRSSNAVTHDALKELRKTRPNCDRLIGMDFLNTQHVLWQNSTFVLMTLHLRPSTRNYSHVIRVDAEVEYTTRSDTRGNISVTIVNPQRMKVEAISDLSHKYSQRLLHQLCREPDDLSLTFASDGEFLHSALAHGHFDGETRQRPLHHPCLYLMTAVFADSAMVEVVNSCTDRAYQVTITAELINVLSLSALPVEVTVRPRDVRFVTSLVKSAYGSRKTAYKILATYKIIQ